MHKPPGWHIEGGPLTVAATAAPSITAPSALAQFDNENKHTKLKYAEYYSPSTFKGYVCSPGIRNYELYKTPTIQCY